MRNLGRALPKLLLPAAIGLGLAYLATGFLPRPAPVLRPPEELLAHGQGLDQDSPVRAVLERNVLRLKSPPFTPPGSPLAAPEAPDQADAAMDRALPAAPTAARGMNATSLAPAANATGPAPAAPASGSSGPSGPSGAGAGAAKPMAVTPPLSGGPSVVGRVAAP